MSKSRAVFGITKKEKNKILKDRLRKENFNKSIRSYRVDNIIKELKEFYNIESKKYKKDETYFIRFDYKDFSFIVRFNDYNETVLNFEKVDIDIFYNKQVIKSINYDNENYLFNLLSLISIYDVKESYFKNEKPKKV